MPEKDILINDSSVAKASSFLSKHFDGFEILAFNDFRERLLIHSLHVEPLSTVQKTTSLLLTLLQKKHMIRKSFILSGWTPISPTFLKNIPREQDSIFEPSEVDFNSSQVLPRMTEGTIYDDWYADIRIKAKKIFRKIKKKFSSHNVHLSYFFHFDRCFIKNSVGLMGSYEHPYTRLEYQVSSKSGQRLSSGLIMSFDHDVDIIEHIDRRLRLPLFKKPGGLGLIRKSKLPAILSPNLVATIAQILFEKSKAYHSWPESYVKALPADLVLHDNPSLGIGQNSVPFDHEGTKTYDKVLVSNSRNVLKVSDRKASFLSGNKPTGNGFRRGLFVSHVGELTPTIQFNYLKIEKGTKSVFEVIKSAKDFIYLDDISYPLDRFQQVIIGRSLAVTEGVLFKDSKPVSRIMSRNYNDRPLISCYPKSHGSLIDSNAIILDEGEFTYMGWFPYIFVPVMTIGHSDE